MRPEPKLEGKALYVLVKHTRPPCWHICREDAVRGRIKNQVDRRVSFHLPLCVITIVNSTFGPFHSRFARPTAETDDNDRMRLLNSLMTYTHGVGGPASRLDAPSQTSAVAYIDSMLLTSCLRLFGISKVWCYFIRIWLLPGREPFAQSGGVEFNACHKGIILSHFPPSTKNTSGLSWMNSHPQPLHTIGLDDEATLLPTPESQWSFEQERTFDNRQRIPTGLCGKPQLLCYHPKAIRWPVL